MIYLRKNIDRQKFKKVLTSIKYNLIKRQNIYYPKGKSMALMNAGFIYIVMITKIVVCSDKNC